MTHQAYISNKAPCCFTGPLPGCYVCRYVCSLLIRMRPVQAPNISADLDEKVIARMPAPL